MDNGKLSELEHHLSSSFGAPLSVFVSWVITNDTFVSFPTMSYFCSDAHVAMSIETCGQVLVSLIESNTWEQKNTQLNFNK